MYLFKVYTNKIIDLLKVISNILVKNTLIRGHCSLTMKVLRTSETV